MKYLPWLDLTIWSCLAMANFLQFFRPRATWTMKCFSLSFTALCLGFIVFYVYDAFRKPKITEIHIIQTEEGSKLQFKIDRLRPGESIDIPLGIRIPKVEADESADNPQT